MKKLGLCLIAVGVWSSVGCRVTVREDPPRPRVVVVEPVHEVTIVERRGPPPPEVVVVVQPPQPRAEVIIGVAPSPNHVWVGGYWHWNGSTHVWMGGGWHPRPRPGAVWVEGRWEQRGTGWVRVEGRWR
jgi:hypothetical protein